MQATSPSFNATQRGTMKLMNSVPAAVSGTVAEICQVNGWFGEQDAVLIRVKS